MKNTKLGTRDRKLETRTSARTHGEHSPAPARKEFMAVEDAMPSTVSPETAARIEQILAHALTLEKFAVPEGRITITAIGQAVGTTRSVMHYAVREMQLETRLERRRRGPGQRGISVSLADARMILGYALRPRERLRKARRKREPKRRHRSGPGYFYIVLLEPELDSGRFKAGFTCRPKQRLKTFRTSAPFGEYIYHWPCQRAWELTARAFITRYCEHLREEVYRTRDIPSLLARAAHFFVEMPDPRQSPSTHQSSSAE